MFFIDSFTAQLEKGDDSGEDFDVEGNLDMQMS